MEVNAFYNFWENFASAHSFTWCEPYDYREAPNRNVRREMEKENKRARTKEKKKYTDMVRALVSFVRSRDTRFIEIKRKEREVKQAKEDEIAAMKALREIQLAEAKQIWREERENELALEEDRLKAANIYRLADEQVKSNTGDDKSDIYDVRYCALYVSSCWCERM